KVKWIVPASVSLVGGLNDHRLAASSETDRKILGPRTNSAWVTLPSVATLTLTTTTPSMRYFSAISGYGGFTFLTAYFSLFGSSKARTIGPGGTGNSATAARSDNRTGRKQTRNSLLRLQVGAINSPIRFEPPGSRWAQLSRARYWSMAARR